MIAFSIIARLQDGVILCEDASHRNRPMDGLREPVMALLKTLSQQYGNTNVNGTRKVDISSSHRCYAYMTGGVITLLVCEKAFNSALAFAFLSEIFSNFENTLCKEVGLGSESLKSALPGFIPYQFVRLDRFLARKATEYVAAAASPRLIQLKSNLDEVKSMMQANLGDLLLRGENLDSMHTKAFELREYSNKFAKNARTLAWKARLQSYLPILLVIAIFLVLIYVFLF